MDRPAQSWSRPGWDDSRGQQRTSRSISRMWIMGLPRSQSDPIEPCPEGDLRMGHGSMGTGDRPHDLGGHARVPDLTSWVMSGCT